MKRELIVGVIGTILGAILTLGTTVGYDIYKDKNMAEVSATLLYHDLNRAIDSIQGTVDLNNTYGTNQVLKNTHVNLYGEQGELLMDLKDKLTSKDLKNILIFYDNLNLLETSRKEYWAAVPENTKEYMSREKHLNTVYVENLNNIFFIYEQNEKGLKQSIEKVKEISSFKNEK
mgnify:CR=1 FL=1